MSRIVLEPPSKNNPGQGGSVWPYGNINIQISWKTAFAGEFARRCRYELNNFWFCKKIINFCFFWSQVVMTHLRWVIWHIKIEFYENIKFMTNTVLFSYDYCNTINEVKRCHCCECQKLKILERNSSNRDLCGDRSFAAPPSRTCRAHISRTRDPCAMKLWERVGYAEIILGRNWDVFSISIPIPNSKSIGIHESSPLELAGQISLDWQCQFGMT